jgi:threonine dehydrogenase-like Zn-dependent dehydrogenase
MKAIVVTPGKRNSVRLEEVDDPKPNESEALLRVIEVGIDGTDIDINEGIYGESPAGSDYLIIGHECLSIVDDISDKSNGISKGDLVVPTVRRPDKCINCLNGESDMCLTGDYKEHGIRGLHGFASEYTKSNSSFLVKVPNDLQNLGVLLEPMSVAEKAVYQAYKLQERMVWGPTKALVLGAGPLGILTTFLLTLKGFEVHAVATRDRESPKARLVQRAGGIYINSREQPISSLGKFDLIMEETGVPNVAMEAQLLLNKNGVMCFLGVYKSKEACRDIGSLYTDLVLGNKIFFGSVNANRKYFELGIKDLGEIQRKFPGACRELITNLVRTKDYEKAFNPSKDDIKSVIDFKT